MRQEKQGDRKEKAFRTRYKTEGERDSLKEIEKRK